MQRREFSTPFAKEMANLVSSRCRAFGVRFGRQGADGRDPASCSAACAGLVVSGPAPLPRSLPAALRRGGGLACVSRRAAISSAVTFIGWWQAARWPLAYSASGGSTLAADVGRARAARVEHAAGRRVDRVRRLARSRTIRSRARFSRGSGIGIAAEQRRRVRVDRLGVELLGRRDLHHLAEVHHRDPVRHVAHHATGRGRRTGR